MMRIDRRLIEAAYDCGASAWQMLTNVIIPLSKPGIAIGSIFVVTIVMGDYITFSVMGGGQIASAGKIIATRLNALQFPPAAASAVILLCATMVIIACSTASSTFARNCDERGTPRRVLLARRLFRAVRAVSLRPDDRDLHPVVSGPDRRPDLPDERGFAALVPAALGGRRHRRHRAARSSARWRSASS